MEYGIICNRCLKIYVWYNDTTMLIWPTFSNWGDMHRWSTFTKLHVKCKQDFSLFHNHQVHTYYISLTVDSEYCSKYIARGNGDVCTAQSDNQCQSFPWLQGYFNRSYTLREKPYFHMELYHTVCYFQIQEHHWHAFHMGLMILGNDLIWVFVFDFRKLTMI